MWLMLHTLLHLTATKQYSYQNQINIAAVQCGVVKIHRFEILCFTFSKPNPIIRYAARLWPCLFWLAAP